MPFNLILKISNIGCHLIVHALFFTFEAGIVLIRLIKLITFVFYCAFCDLKFIIELGSKILHLMDCLSILVLLKVKLVAMSDFYSANTLSFTILSFLLKKCFAIFMLSHESLNLALKLTYLRD